MESFSDAGVPFIKEEEEEDVSRSAPVKEEPEVVLPFEVDDIKIEAEELEWTPSQGGSYSSEKFESISAVVTPVEVEEELHSLAEPSGTKRGKSSQHGRRRKARSAQFGWKGYKCSDCGKWFISPSALEIHARVHTGDKPFHCMECGKSFSMTGSLKSHARIHTGDKPFHCVECGKSFSNRSNLITHTRIHSGDKPYHCVECGKSFSTAGYLRQHARIHTGEKPYHCVECGKSFRHSSALWSHSRRHH